MEEYLISDGMEKYLARDQVLVGNSGFILPEDRIKFVV